ncbi:MAG: HpcH/HpaI aldolase family protein [Actinomycetota bacterium]
MSTLKELWASGGTAVGVWLALPSSITAEVAARSGADFVCADLQHGVNDPLTLAGLAQAARLGGSRPIARVAWNDPSSIGRALDLGAEGVIVPMVNSGPEAVAAVAAARYAPVGIRSFGPIVTGMHLPGYAAHANDTVALIPMIETVAALQHLDDILSTPGIDAIYIGPDDLGISLGLPVGTRDEHPVFAEAVQTVLDGCRRHGVVPGIHATGGWAPRRLEQGFRLMAATSELGAMEAGLAQAMGAARGAQGSR